MQCYIDKKTVSKIITKCNTALKFAKEKSDSPYAEIFQEIIGTLEPFNGKKDYTSTNTHYKITKRMFDRYSLEEINKNFDFTNMPYNDFLKFDSYRIQYNHKLSNRYDRIVWSNDVTNTLVYWHDDYID